LLPIADLFVPLLCKKNCASGLLDAKVDGENSRKLACRVQRVYSEGDSEYRPLLAKRVLEEPDCLDFPRSQSSEMKGRGREWNRKPVVSSAFLTCGVERVSEA